VDAVLNGHITDADGRHELAEIAGRSRIIESVVRATPGILRGREDDVASHIYETVTTKIMVPSSGGYSFESGQNRSFSGFIRQLAKQIATRSAVRDEVHAPMARATPMWVAPGDSRSVGSASGDNNNFENMNALLERGSGIVFGTTPTMGADEALLAREDATHSDAEVDVVIEGSSHLMRKPEHQPHYHGAIVRAVTGVPEAIRPTAYAKRKALLRRLTGPSGVALAEASLRAAGRDQSDLELTDLVDLWGDYTTEDIRVLLVRGPDMIHAVALAAVSDYPLPNRTDRRTLRIRLAAMSQDPDYRELLNDLVRSLLAVECHWTSSSARHDTQGVDLNTADVKLWRTLTGQLAKIPGAPLGGRVTEVEAKLRAILIDVMPAMDYDAIVAASAANIAERGQAL